MKLTGCKRKQPTCRLITLCSDNSSIDLKVLNAIIAYAAVIVTPQTRAASAQSQSTTPGDGPAATTTTTTTTVKSEVEGDPMNAAMATLQAVFGNPSTPSGNGNNNNNAVIGSSIGRTGKTKGNKKAATASPPRAAAAAAASLTPKLLAGHMAPTNADRSIFESRLMRQPCEWYSVLQSPQWEVPLVFIHKLPDVDCGDDETSSVITSSQRGTSRDFATTLQRALQIITEEIETPTTGLGNQNNNNNNNTIDGNGPADINADHMGKEGGVTAVTVSESSATTIPFADHIIEEATPPIPSKILNEGTFKDIAVVLTLQDPRFLPLLMNSRKTLAANNVDMRLIVNFVDTQVNQGVRDTSCDNTGGSVPTQRPRTASIISRRTNTRDNTTITPPGISTESDRRAASTIAMNTFETWIDRYQREGDITVISSPSAASHATNILCLREAFDEASDYKKLWIQRCVQDVLPIMQNITRDMAQYTDWLSSKVIHEYPSTVWTQQEEDTSMYGDSTIAPYIQQRSRMATRTSVATTAVERERARSTVKEASITPQFVEQTRPYKEDRYSCYLRERKVRGQWTCVSAVRALAAQATVLLARQQEPRIVQTTLEDKSTQGATGAGAALLDNPPGESGGMEATNASLRQQLRLYSTAHSVLATLDENDVGNRGSITPAGGEMDTATTITTTTTTTTKAKGRGTEQSKRSTLSVPTATTAAKSGTVGSALSVSMQENEKTDRFDVTATLPLDHTMDRPSLPPHPDEIRWLTHQFVRKGLGLFSVPHGELDSSFIKDVSGTTTVSSNRSEDFQAVLRIRELLEDPLNGLTVEEGDDAVDMHLLELIESDFRHTAKELPFEWTRVCEAAAISFARPVVKEELQRSVERSLTPRERTHIMQQIFLEHVAANARMSDVVIPGAGVAASSVRNNSKEGLLTSIDEAAEFTGTPSLSIEEFLTKPVAIQRLYNFQSRFGTHLCRLLHCTVPDPLESLNGPFTASYSAQAVNVYPPKRVTSAMLAGLPVPQQRQVHRVWCYYVYGVPSLNQFNELVVSEAAIASDTNNNTTTTTTNTTDMREVLPQSIHSSLLPLVQPGTATPGTASAGWGGAIGDILRRQLLCHLRGLSQLLVPTGGETEKMTGSVWNCEGTAQTVLEGRHSLFPHDDSVVEIVTTDRSRMCRYVKSSEINCVLHYHIPSPSVASSNSSAPIGFAGSFPLGPSTPKRSNEEAIYFTVVFDDGVVLTCTQRVSPPLMVDTNAMTMGSERDIVGSVSAKSLNTRRGKPSPRSGRSQAGLSTGFTDDTPVGGHRVARRHKSRNRDGDTLSAAAAAAAASSRPDEPPRPFPVAQDGSVLLSGITAPNATSDTVSAPPGTTHVPSSPGISRGIPKLAVTIAANGFTLHSEEYEAVLWITHCETSNYSTPELMRCMHSCDTNATLGDTMEVEVRRAVLEEIGALCRYFQSGAIQTLYPDGSVLTRYPVPSLDANSLQVLVETLTTASGECYVRQICEGVVGGFSHVRSNKIETRMTFDRGNNCRILSRADRVIIVYYYHRYNECVNGSEKVTSTGLFSRQNTGNGGYDHLDCTGIQQENMPSGVPLDVSSSVIACVTLHADGTCITSFSTSERLYYHNNAPTPLQPLLEHVQVVETACESPVQYCIEAPSLPRIFLCAVANDANKENEENPVSVCSLGVAGEGGNTAAGVSVVSDISAGVPLSPRVTASGKMDTVIDRPVILSPLSDAPSSVFGAAVREELTPRHKTAYDRFYIVFGDGSVLRRRVTYHGARGSAMPFLETLFTRPTESSVRIIHESGLAIVEPAEAVRRNSHSPTSLAIGEGFAMFDLTLGGMRLVDYQHHVTEVRDLFSPGSVYADMKPAKLEELLHQLVLPTYTPHAVPKARRKAMQEEELATELQSRRDRAAGVCPPLLSRLREQAEGFIIAHELLRIDKVNSAKRQWESNRVIGNKGKVAFASSADASWGRLSSLMRTTEGDSLQRALASLNMCFSATAAALPPMRVAPLFFSELDNGVVIQYLHERDVEEYMRSKDAEPFPIFLSHSTSSGEPGVQQLTFFSAEAANGVISGPSVTDIPRQSPCSFSPSSTPLRSSFGRTTGCKNTVVMGSLLGSAVQRQKQLALFPGKPAPFPTTRWLPPAMQPPRRFLEPNLTTHDGGAGGLVLVDRKVQEDDVDGLLQSSYRRLRVFLKFTEATRVAQQVVLLGEAMRYKQLAAMVAYQRAMRKGSVGNECESEAEAEQRRLRERYYVAHS